MATPSGVTDVRKAFEPDTRFIFACSCELILTFSNGINFDCPQCTMHCKEIESVDSILYPQIYSGARDGSVVASKLDLRVYHTCKVTSYT